MTDEQIIEKFLRSGESSDWEELVHRHFNQIHGLAFKMSGNRTRADDISQDVFLKVAKSLKQFEGKSKFSTWLFRIAMNTIYTHLKKESKSKLRFESVDQNFTSPTDVTPDRNVLKDELASEVERGIQALKPEFRAAIILTAFQNLSPGEAADVEGCTPQTMYWRLNQARTQLKQKLNRYFNHEQ